ncbi:ATP-binding protein [Thermus sp. SYSU G05001]|uniref:ATP-binding protein n=1 Tax=Thermus brevis TaxID=2862456 RepID=A0ABS7A2R9_9DEIN|nr:ATP-binding protein [Thermus brevis]MBW6396047.1 ATP-binding protein [Thermus brevis]
MFVGRKEEGRAVLLSVRAGRGVVLSAPPGYGKTALLRELLPALEAWAPVVWTERVAPFGAFLKDLFRGLWDAGVPVEGVGRGKDPETDLKAWQKRYPGNEEKARSLVKALKRPEGVNPITLVVDDATGITPSMVPWLVAFAEAATLVLAVHPETLRKGGTKRLWMRLDRVDLPPLSPKETRELARALVERYGVVAEDLEAYLNRVVSLSGGVPGEVERLVRYVSAEDIVRNRDVGTGYAEGLARREERGIALAPILLVAGGVAIAARYLGLARGEMDLYVAGGLGIAAFVVLSPWLRKVVVAR